MPDWTRRDFLKSGIAASAGAASLGQGAGGLLAAPGRAPVADAGQPTSTGLLRERLLLDFGWRFHLGSAADPLDDFDFGMGQTYQKTGDFSKPSGPDFDDSDWEAIDLPHDWAVVLPFHEDAWLAAHGSKPLGRNYPETSIGWYRRVFEIPSGDLGRRLSLEFDGVFRDSMVALNGNLLGRNLSGYAPFSYDITDHVLYGRRNVLVVRVDATEHEGWWYEGAGIYRHVWLVKTNPVHVPQWGTFVSSEVNGNSATLTITTEVSNDQDDGASCTVVSKIVDSKGNAAGTHRAPAVSIPGWQRRKITQKVKVGNPQLWSIEEPNMYRLETTVEVNGAAADTYETPFGIRTIRFDKDKGFFLNGKPVKIKGTCNHQDHAGVGIALPDRLQYFRITKLKEMGSNGLRTSHNPPTPELLDACDRLGMVVLDETRMFSSAPEGLSQLGRLVRRDRNHPSVVFWSTGNEEDEQGSERGARMCRAMKRLARRLDPTRPVTQAMNNGWGEGISTVLDIMGFNYKHSPEIDAFRRKFPNQPCVGTETASTVSTRGIYFNDPGKGYVSSYDVNYPPWASSAEEWWQTYDQRPWLSGGFVWTGFDYRGEPTPYGWPCISSHFGLIDTCGIFKDLAYYYKAWWGEKPVLHLFPHWNWDQEGKPIDIWCFTNLEKVELFLNGRSLGMRAVGKNSHAAWNAGFMPGAIEARGYKGGGQVLTVKRETTGAPAKIVLKPDRAKINADGEDVSVVFVSVADSQGRVVPVAHNLISFQVTGAGRLIGVGNGDPSSHEADKASRRHAFNGLCVAIVQSTKQAGQVSVRATSPGLEPAEATIECGEITPRPAVA
ncbi:MAG TPA: beta-galactosidase GalA [Terriglobia bacterium]|nr:beta-galactosidase GalA [Terriglobia bacterium]